MNPFKMKNQMLPIASINSIYVDDVLARDMFRPELIVQEIKKNRDYLGFSSDINDEYILYKFNGYLNNKDFDIRTKANEIAVSFGKKLANVIITLYNPSELSLKNHPIWTAKYWDYWKEVKKIYFVGGLTSPILTSIFYEQIKVESIKQNISNLNVSFIEGSVDLGTKGLSTLVENGEYLLFDFGQTNIKRRHLIKSNKEIEIDCILYPIKSRFLDYKGMNYEQLIESSLKLDDFILNTVMETISSVLYKGDYILIAIANYVYEGNIYSKRGGYAKLSYIKGNYEQHLSHRLSSLLSRKIDVKLYHDTSAMALNFKNIERTAVISLGTAFGIAFVE